MKSQQVEIEEPCPGKVRVLIVEDSDNDAELIMWHLRKGGLRLDYRRVDEAESMRRALIDETWDLIITDHNLPQFNSHQAIALVKECELDLPVIIVSGQIGEEIAIQAMKDGAQDYVMKDNLNRLVPAIKRELRDAESRKARQKAENEVHYLSYHDALTNLANRLEFEEQLQAVLTSAIDEHRKHALLYLDLDQFRIVNDTCGHIAGDDLLKQLARLLQGYVHTSDTLARLGGDEFGILLMDCSPAESVSIAENIRKAIQSFRYIWRTKPFALSVSIGVVQIISDKMGANEILSAADVACDAAKDMGKNRIHVYDQRDQLLLRKQNEMQWASRIKQALDEDRFVLFKQTILPLGLHGSSTEHCEILVRMHERDGSILPPAMFIAAAERYNLMPALDRWVCDTAFKYIAEKTRGKTYAGHHDTFFINISATTLNDDSFFKYIEGRIKAYNIQPQLLCFELTETAAISNYSSALSFIEGVRRLGCSMALDDFGVGWSSFSYLKNFPVDYIKIDGGFIRNMLNDTMDNAIVESINRIGHLAGLKTIAECVESLEIKDQLEVIGNDYVQGFAIDRPQPIAVD